MAEYLVECADLLVVVEANTAVDAAGKAAQQWATAGDLPRMIGNVLKSTYLSNEACNSWEVGRPTIDGTEFDIEDEVINHKGTPAYALCAISDDRSCDVFVETEPTRVTIIGTDERIE